MKLISEILGFVGVGLNAIVYQQKKRERLLIFKLISDVVWMFHYGLMYNFSGAAVATIGIARESTFLVTDRKGMDRRPFLLVFLGLACISVWLTWKGWYSILPAAASFLSVISFWQQKPRVSRILALPISACMVTYSIMVSSYAGITNEIFTVTSTLIGIVRHDIMLCRRKEKTENNINT